MNDQPSAAPTASPILTWTEAGQTLTARWQSENGAPPPKRVETVDDGLTADQAYRLACAGTAMLWRGDFHNARQLLQALVRRVDKPRKPGKNGATPSPQDVFNRHRLAQSQRARLLGMILLPFDDDYRIPLRRAPDVAEACREAYGPAQGPFVASLRELLGLIGAHEWRRRGVDVPTIGGRIHPHYGVFSPVRGEYLDLLALAPLPAALAQQSLAFDIGTGTGVIAALLARRGVNHIVATDLDPRALACAEDNLSRLGLDDRVQVQACHLFPPDRAPLVVCNPPWLPARPGTPIERAIYDPESAMLKGFLAGLTEHLSPGGEGWLILSDLAEHLGLRSRDALLTWIDAAGLQVLARHDVRPKHPKALDPSDALHHARAAEVTSLWRLAAKLSC